MDCSAYGPQLKGELAPLAQRANDKMTGACHLFFVSLAREAVVSSASHEETQKHGHEHSPSPEAVGKCERSVLYLQCNNMPDHEPKSISNRSPPTKRPRKPCSSGSPIGLRSASKSYTKGSPVGMFTFRMASSWTSSSLYGGGRARVVCSVY